MNTLVRTSKLRSFLAPFVGAAIAQDEGPLCNLDCREMVRLDLDYVASRSLARDLGIVVRTFAAVLAGRGAC
jgi:lipopolysaccharide/colanic/teichoic acid biosynthesis glycosyltransferase